MVGVKQLCASMVPVPGRDGDIDTDASFSALATTEFKGREQMLHIITVYTQFSVCVHVCDGVCVYVCVCVCVCVCICVCLCVCVCVCVCVCMCVCVCVCDGMCACLL